LAYAINLGLPTAELNSEFFGRRKYLAPHLLQD